MQYALMSGLLLVLGLLFFVLGASTLFKKDWFIGWLRGMMGMVCFSIAASFGLVALNIYGYKSVGNESIVATVGIEKTAKQQFSLAVTKVNGLMESYPIAGDLWQIDARILKWHGPLLALGVTPGFKLDRIQGRYLSLEDERGKERTVHPLSDPDIGFDAWQAIKNLPWLPWVDAQYGSATYVPLADGAVFKIYLASSGLIARPANEKAEAALNEWN